MPVAADTPAACTQAARGGDEVERNVIVSNVGTALHGLLEGPQPARAASLRCDVASGRSVRCSTLSQALTLCSRLH